MERIAAALFIASILLITGCTKFYAPLPGRETEEFKKANKTIYPKDILADHEKFKDSTIVWPGIIRRCEISETDSKYMVELFVEHHYYDWLLDFGAQKEKIFLSPKGEGNFRTRWIFKEGTKREDIESNSKPEDLVIVYGKPAKMAGDTILVNSTCVRPFDKKWYSTEYLDYGRSENK